ncbi:RNA polymerase sigma factor [Aquimarina sp. 2201CG14-23]|uniref:RNA polymerase sigma factor n=1 Tax=Aquimarina mycalae TaxID=3040073 RepID=UPI002477F7F8|nr:RNA polymerase sigma factor [Aquimarina sp. 2201CG14-23]MDH7445125.1 RNA polymerase sigma factor [Aquimarina sp. 2201CG14-23]
MNNRDLIKKCKKNDREAQSELFYTYKDKLFSLCLKYCRNYDEAEDILQDSFLTIFKKINQYNNKGSFEGWMKRITINKAIDRYKDDFFVNTPLKEELISDTKVDTETFQFSIDELLSFIQKLPTKYRLVFSLYELDDYSHKEIAHLLKISEGTSKSNLHRAKLLLKTMITSLNYDQKKIAVSNG